jgi:glycosyltransferase involved in cell wall biosynthesis
VELTLVAAGNASGQPTIDRIADSTPLRVAADFSISRHPPAGTLRWVRGLLTALHEMPEIHLSAWPGHSRLRRGGPARKILNLLVDEFWLEVELPRRVKRDRSEVLLMPANVSSGRSPVPQVVTILDVNFLVVPGSYDRAYATYARRRFMRSLSVAERITTISEYSRDQIVKHLGADPESIEVVYPGLEAPRGGRAASPLARPYALYVGHTEPHKDVPTAIEAWRALGDVGIDLAIVGPPGRDHERVLARSASDPTVHIVGAVSDSELEDWYAHASVFVFPSLTEGFGYPPLEAMARGVPVVSSRAGSLPEVLGDAALFFEPGRSDDLALQVRRVLGDETLRQTLVRRGEERVQRYTWQASAERMALILRSAAGKDRERQGSS